jgi:hypothetical protein
MAIKQNLKKDNVDNDYGYNFDDAYFKVENIRIDVARNQANIEVRGYASETARNIENSIGIFKKVFKCSLADLNLDIAFSKNISIKDSIKTSAYEYLKKKYFSKGKDV